MKIDIKKLCTWMIILFMPLSLYVTFIPKVTLGDIGLLVIVILTILTAISCRASIKDIISNEILMYVVLILINSIIQIFIDYQSLQDGIYSLLRYLLFLLVIMFIPRYFLNKEYTYKIYEKMGILFAIYAVLQFICFYMFKYILPINLLPLQTSVDLTVIQNLSRYTSNNVLFRPYSIFIEPSYFAIFESYLLYWLVNFKNKEKNDNIKVSIIAISMILSGTTGIVMVAIAFFKKIVTLSRKNLLKAIVILIFILIIFVVFINTSYGTRIFSRIFNGGGLGSSTEGRIGNLLQIIQQGNINLIGHGIWVEYDYLPSAGRILVSLGIIGALIVVSIIIKMFDKTDAIGNSYIVLFLISWLATNSLFNITSVLVLSLIVMHYKREEEEK